MSDQKFERRQVEADLLEATPGMGGLGFWVMASPLLGFLGWLWFDLIRLLTSVDQLWLDLLLGIVTFVLIIVLPLGYVAFWLVTALPRLFSHAGWSVQPREPVRMAEMHTVRYLYRDRYRARTSGTRIAMRVAQGWFYLEVAAILIGAVLIVPLFFSALEFGFGQ
jgi:hypothetical protein